MKKSKNLPPATTSGRKNMKKNNIFWVMLGPTGYYFPGEGCTETESQCWTDFITTSEIVWQYITPSAIPLNHTRDALKKMLYRDGWRAVEVKITETKRHK